MRARLRLGSACAPARADLSLHCALCSRPGSYVYFMRPVVTFIWMRGCAGWSWSSLVAYLCTAGIAVPRITCFIVHCRYFLCDVAGVAHRITLRLRARRHLYLLFITSWRSRDGETLMLIHDKDYFVLVLIYCTKLLLKLEIYIYKILLKRGAISPLFHIIFLPVVIVSC